MDVGEQSVMMGLVRLKQMLSVDNLVIELWKCGQPRVCAVVCLLTMCDISSDLIYVTNVDTVEDQALSGYPTLDVLPAV